MASSTPTVATDTRESGRRRQVTSQASREALRSKSTRMASSTPAMATGMDQSEAAPSATATAVLAGGVAAWSTGRDGAGSAVPRPAAAAAALLTSLAALPPSLSPSPAPPGLGTGMPATAAGGPAALPSSPSVGARSGPPPSASLTCRDRGASWNPMFRISSTAARSASLTVADFSQSAFRMCCLHFGHCQFNDLAAKSFRSLSV
mmetsp:Transcript_35121/g.91898  ORF Transcript_35121/g.91898 Transcript_35121/m.91898 type:complete len:205 (-) Transcript_35121:464-1078(-)|eukprot:CAMPEP_0206309506 /NCGR_PEP_ID=MMETSP0106_2-20121207/12425_1 /ASSEMBLY_ACC=CAM_ASM_000206 /TAXON_ID=81532 /ORGANISM="Acanthoeca-like sp., Strain 10tr" /LENGTH=204 /DNA_ID=CAMNT_0053740609 /DNA_START=198 /DNA_END=812 /DNA_ORIENTATION=+